MPRTRRFKGFHKSERYGEGSFTVGKDYELVGKINRYMWTDTPDARFRDDKGYCFWVELPSFERPILSHIKECFGFVPVDWIFSDEVELVAIFLVALAVAGFCLNEFLGLAGAR